MITPDKSDPVVLLAEDSEDDAYFFQRAFKKACLDCSLVRAGDGKAAVELLLKAFQARGPLPFLLFLDLKMPIMSGFEVLQWLRAESRNPKPKVIVLSGSNDQADRLRASSLGAADYLVKPITAELLRERVLTELKCRGEGQTQTKGSC